MHRKVAQEASRKIQPLASVMGTAGYCNAFPIGLSTFNYGMSFGCTGTKDTKAKQTIHGSG